MAREKRKKGKERDLAFAVKSTQAGGQDAKVWRFGWLKGIRWRYLLPPLAAIVFVLGGWRAVQFCMETSTFTLEALEVQGLNMLRGRDILEASGLDVGDNIFAVDLADVAVQVEHLPWVEKVLIERKPPDRLVISVVERQRLAWVELGEIYGVDKEGVLLPAANEENESYRDLDLPVISGLQTVDDSLKTGEALDDSTLTEILTWWQQANVYDAEFCMNVSEIQPLGDEGLRLRLVGDGLEVRLPLDRVSERLRVLKRLMARVYRECPDPAYIDLRFAGQVVVGTATAKQSS